MQLAIIGDRTELILADEAFVYQHPHPPDDTLNPLAAEILPHWQALDSYLNRNMHGLEEQIEARFAAREAAGEPDPIYRAWIFQPLEVRAARFAKST